MRWYCYRYVRKNAVLTVFTIYQALPDLIPNAPELIETFLYSEANPSAKKNAFLMLYHCDSDRALTFLNSVLNTISSLGESFQLIVLELIRKVCRANPLAKSQYIR
jgi:coatomer subunit beta